MDTDRARERAETNFNKKETQRLEARKAMADYDAESAAAREKTARLRALRLARDAADAAAVKPVKSANSAKKKPA